MVVHVDAPVLRFIAHAFPFDSVILDGGRNESIGFGPKLDVMHASVNIDAWRGEERKLP
jgi:hypothetical protein